MPYLVTNQSRRYFHTVWAGQTSLAKFNFQIPESYRKDRMPFLPPKLWAVWKIWPSGAILSFSLRLQDIMAHSGQNFHTSPAFGVKNVTVLLFVSSKSRLYVYIIKILCKFLGLLNLPTNIIPLLERKDLFSVCALRNFDVLWYLSLHLVFWYFSSQQQFQKVLY